MSAEETCSSAPQSPPFNGTHCRHWYDGEACCFCNAPAMTAEERAEQGCDE